MQVNLDLNSRPQPKFTAINYKDRNVASYIFNRLSSRDSIIYRYIDIESEKIPVTINLSTIKNFFGQERLLVEVEGQQFKEGFFKSAIKAIIDGLEHSKKLYEQQRLSDMNISHMQ